MADDARRRCARSSPRASSLTNRPRRRHRPRTRAPHGRRSPARAFPPLDCDLVGRLDSASGGSRRNTVLRRSRSGARTVNRTEGLRRRHRPAELQPDQDRAAAPSSDHPDLELQLVVAASALLDRYGSAVRRTSRRTASRSRPGSTWSSRARTRHHGQDHRPRAARAGHGLRQPPSRTSSSPSPTATRRWPRRSRPSYMNIPVAHVQGGEVTGLDRREGAARRHQAGRPAPRLDRAGRRARHAHGRGAGRRSSSPAARRSTSRPRCCSDPALDFDPFEKYGGVGAAGRPLRRLPRRDAAPGDHRVRAGAASTSTETLHAVADVGAARRCGSGRTSTPAPTAPRTASAPSASRRAPRNIHFFKNMAPIDFLRLLVQQPLPGRQLQRRHPRVLVPRRAGRQHRHAPDRAATAAAT